MRADSVASSFIRYQTLRMIIITLALMAVPHVLYLPPWISIATYLLLGYRLLSSRYGLKTIPRWLLTTITLMLVMALLVTYRKLFGREVGVALLILMLAMKTLELRSLRDVMVVVCLGYFLVITGFLFSQSIPMALYLLLTVLLMTTALVDLNRTVLADTFNSHYWRQNLRKAGVMLLQAVPLMLVLFVLFPRISGPLWSLPEDAHTARSGLSDTMSPGDISKLILSDDVAFRARFSDTPPPHAQRYWRGPVLWHYDGNSWRRNRPGTKRAPTALPVVSTASADYAYEITVESNMGHWPLALDLPVVAPTGILITDDSQLYSADKIDRGKRYRVSSSTQVMQSVLHPFARQRALQLPLQSSPRARELAQRWRQQGDEAYVVRRALEYFRTQPFVYTLLPQLLNKDPVDQFLFETREGFCEHYASSFVTLMRAAGIPARVVTGYLGGEMNRFGDYMTVYQSEAHAWSEVWLQGEGWVRIDPTAAIAPERVQSRIDTSSLRQGESVLYQVDLPRLLQILNTVRQGWDYLDHYWQEWVISYDELRQYDLLRALGIDKPGWKDIGLSLLVAFSSIMAVITAFMLYQRPSNTDPVQKCYIRFCKKLGRLGLQRLPNEGALDFASRVSDKQPQLASEIKKITKLYLKLRYGKYATSVMLNEFKQQVDSFSAR